MSIRLETQVPEIYVNESRDFQMFCRLFNIYLGYVKESSDKIQYICDIDKVDSKLLPAIANMLGFTTNMYIPENVLRNICKVFPYCIRNKGTVEAIRTAAYAVLSADQDVITLSVDYVGRTNSEGDTLPDSEAYVLTIYTNVSTQNSDYLDELLQYIVPTGMSKVTVVKVSNSDSYESSVSTSDSINRVRVSASASSTISNSDDYTGETIYVASSGSILNDDLSTYSTATYSSGYTTTYNKINYIKINKSGNNLNDTNKVTIEDEASD